MADRQERRFSAKWDVRTGSPRKLWRALHDFLDDHGFQHEYQELRLEDSPIEGTATFSNWLIGFRDRKEASSLAFPILILGVLLCLTILLIPLGLLLLKNRYRTIRTWATVSAEGEVYRTRGADIQAAHAAEVLDVVADTRITLDILAGEADISDDYEIKRPIRANVEISRLEIDFTELQKNLDSLLQDISPD